MTSRSPRLVVSIALVAGLVLGMADFAKDGEPLNEPQRLNTLDIAQGETYEVVFRAGRLDHRQAEARNHVTLVGEGDAGHALVERHAVAYDGTRDDGNAGHERHAGDVSLSGTEAA